MKFIKKFLNRASSKPPTLTNSNGDGTTFLSHYTLSRKIIGQGEFGTVKLVTSLQTPSDEHACKILKKGRQFRDNVIYPPSSPKNSPSGM